MTILYDPEILLLGLAIHIYMHIKGWRYTDVDIDIDINSYITPEFEQ